MVGRYLQVVAIRELGGLGTSGARTGHATPTLTTTTAGG